MHLIIGVDFALHVCMLAAMFLAIFYFVKMTRLPKPPGSAVTLNILFVLMGGIIGYMAWCVLYAAHFCFSHYAQWWSR